jgi:hypothetical protein
VRLDSEWNGTSVLTQSVFEGIVKLCQTSAQKKKRRVWWHTAYLYVFLYGKRCRNRRNNETMQSYVSLYFNDEMTQNLLQFRQACEAKWYEVEIRFEGPTKCQHKRLVTGFIASKFITQLVNWYCVTGTVLYILWLGNTDINGFIYMLWIFMRKTNS